MQIYQGNLKSGTFKSIRESVMEVYQGNLSQGVYLQIHREI